jgi:Zn-dependent protease
MPIRENIGIGFEVKQILTADIVLIIAFSLTLSGGIFKFFQDPGTFINSFVSFLPIVVVAVTLSFILHELMHKFVAQRYGAIAGFRTSVMGLAITIITGMFGFLLGIPGATMIYVHSFTKKENGIVSLAGPLTNLCVFAAFFTIGILMNPATGSYLYTAISFTIFISLLLAFFNMLPISPLDGSKVFAWSKPVYIVTMGTIFLLILYFGVLPLMSIVYLLIIAIVLSGFYRNII